MSLGKSEGSSKCLSKLFWGSFCCFCQVRKGVEGFPKRIIIHKGVFAFVVRCCLKSFPFYRVSKKGTISPLIIPLIKRAKWAQRKDNNQTKNRANTTQNTHTLPRRPFHMHFINVCPIYLLWLCSGDV